MYKTAGLCWPSNLVKRTKKKCLCGLCCVKLNGETNWASRSETPVDLQFLQPSEQMWWTMLNCSSDTRILLSKLFHWNKRGNYLTTVQSAVSDAFQALTPSERLLTETISLLTMKKWSPIKLHDPKMCGYHQCLPIKSKGVVDLTAFRCFLLLVSL